MSQFLHAGIIAGRRQLAALIVLTLVLVLTTPLDHITQNSSAPNKAEILPLPATQLFTLGSLLIALGLALTNSLSIEVTASRMRRASHFMRLGSPKYILMTLVAQFGLAAILFAAFALQAPPSAIVSLSHYFGCTSAVLIVWPAAMSMGVACFGATAHSAVNAIET